MYRKVSAVLAALAGFLSQAALAVPVGYYGYWGMGSSDMQQPPAIAVSPRGDTTTVWRGTEPFTSAPGIFMWRSTQLFGSGNQVRISPAAQANASHPDVASSATGEFIVVWQADVAGGQGVYAQRFTADAQPVGPWFLVNEAPAPDPRPAIAADAFGNFVVAWQAADGLGGNMIVARRFLSNGTAVASAFRIDDPAGPVVSAPRVAMAPRGEFIVAWEGTSGGAGDVYFRSYAADGTPISGIASPGAAEPRRSPAVALDGHANCVLAWRSEAGGTASVRVRRFALTGAPATAEILVSEDVAPIEDGGPSVGADASGDFVVTWQHPSHEFSNQIFAVDGTPVGIATPFEWNETYWPDATMDADGDVYVAYGGPEWGGTESFMGPETIDLSFTIDDTVDPVNVGDTVTYQLTEHNLHPSVVETGIDAIDSAIGFALFTEMGLDLPAGMHFQDASVPCSAYKTMRFCRAGDVAPGGVKSITVDLVADETGVKSVPAWTYGYHLDPDQPGQDEDTETTTVHGCNDAGTISVSAPSTVAEGGTVEIAVTRSGGTCGPASASYTLGDASSGWNSDYNPATGTLAWADGESGTRTVVLETLQDDIDEDDQPIDFTLANPQRATLENAAATIVLVDDDDEPTFTIEPEATEVAEGNDGDRTVRIWLNLSRLSERGVFVPYTVSGSAGDADRTVAPADGIDPLQQPIEVIVHGDSAHEGDETVVIVLGQATNATVSGPNAFTITIRDDDALPVVSVASADFALAEGATGSILVAVSGAHPEPITVPLQWAGVAVRGTDFSAPATVVISPADTFVSIPVSALADGIDESVETTTLTLAQPGNAALGGDISLVLSIKDTNPTPAISFTRSTATVHENAGSVKLAVTLSAPSSRVTRVTLYTSGKATLGDDYTLSQTTISIPAGATTGSATMYVVNDKDIELDEVAKFSLGGQVNCVLGEITQQSVTIQDNDPTIPGVGGVR